MSRDFGEDAFSFGVRIPRQAAWGWTGAAPYWESAFDAWRSAFVAPDVIGADDGFGAGDARALVPLQAAFMAAAFAGAAGFMLGLAAGAALAQTRLAEGFGDVDG